MKKFVEPEIEIAVFDVEDIITVSLEVGDPNETEKG